MPRSVFTDAYASFREALVAARKSARVTQVELAERLGKPQQFVSKIENGDRRVDLIEFVAICRALRVEPKDAFAAVLRRLPKSFDI
ncbi:MAG: helix-turn-helix domain-containing protein [Hyphomonadaceae bacterium JAD_PAG50586_4]|nr:MAG: helix-turn-helix domain-containing protein [Hyphomonadaceae bacterium JAD_PAG50586_4]